MRKRRIRIEERNRALISAEQAAPCSANTARHGASISFSPALLSVFVLALALLPGIGAAQLSVFEPQDIRIAALSCSVDGAPLDAALIESLWNPSQSGGALQMGFGPSLQIPIITAVRAEGLRLVRLTWHSVCELAYEGNGIWSCAAAKPDVYKISVTEIHRTSLAISNITMQMTEKEKRSLEERIGTSIATTASNQYMRITDVSNATALRVKIEYLANPTFVCNYTFKEPQPWSAFEVEAARPVRLVRVVATTAEGIEHAIEPGDGWIGPGDRLRLQPPRPLKAKSVAWTMAAQCAGQSWCGLALSDVSVFPPTLELAPSVESAEPDAAGEQRFTFLPGEGISLKGYVNSRNYACEGSRVYCAWGMEAKCKRKHGGLDKDCVYHMCPSEKGRFTDAAQGLIDVLFLSSDQFDSGRCKSWVETWGLKVLGTIISIIGLATGQLWLAALGQTLTMYNIDLSFAEQWWLVPMFFINWLVLAPQVSAMSGLIEQGLWGEFFFMIGKSAVEQILTKYVAEKLFDELPTAMQAILTAFVVTLATDLLAKGFVDVFNVEFSGGLSYLMADMNDFMKVSVQNAVNAMFDKALRAGAAAMANSIAQECAEKYADDPVKAGGCQLAGYALNNALNYAINQIKWPSTEVAAWSKLSEEERQNIIYYASESRLAPGSEDAAIAAVESAKGLSTADKGQLKSAIESAEDWAQEVKKFEMGRQFLQLSQDARNFVSTAQSTVRTAIELEKAREAAAEQLEDFVMGQSCACYGSLRMSPQFLQRPADCKNFMYGGRPLFAFYGSIGPPDKVVFAAEAETGNGWCRPPVIEDGEHVLQITSGISSAALKGEGGVLWNASGRVKDGWLDFTTSAPSEPGAYTIEMAAAVRAPSATAYRISAAAIAFASTTGDLFMLPLALNQSAELLGLIDGLAEAGLSGLGNLRASTAAMADFLWEIGNASRSAPEDIAASINAAKTALDAEIATMRTVRSRLENATLNATPLAELMDRTQDASVRLLGLLDGTSVLELVDIHGQSDRLLSELDALDVQSNVSLKVLNDTANRIATLSNETFEIEWEIVEWAGWGGTRRLDIIQTQTSAVTFGNITNVYVPYERWMNNGNPESLMYTLETNLSGWGERTAEALRGLYGAAAEAMETEAAGDVPEHFLESVSAVRSLKAGIDSVIAELNGTLAKLYGNVDEVDGTISPTIERFTECLPDLPGGRGRKCSTMYRYTLSADRAALERAAETLRVLKGLSRALDDGVERATAAVWQARIAAAGTTGQATAALEAGIDAIEEWLDRIGDEHKSELDARIDDTLDEAYKLTSRLGFAERTVRVEVPIQVVRPALNVSASPSVQCGSGEQQDYNITMRADITPLAIPVSAGMWTPFSVPWIPKSPSGITLAELGPDCSVSELAWWNASSQQAVYESEPANAALLPGRGYYVLTDNDCELRFGSELFKAGGTVDLAAAENDALRVNATADQDGVAGIAGGWVLVGSGGVRLPFDAASLAHELSFDRIVDTYYNFLSKNCPPLRHEVYEGFARERGLANWTEMYEALPGAEPFLMPNASQPAQWLEPGKAYWLRTRLMVNATAGQPVSYACNLNNLPAAFPTTVWGMPRAAGLNAIAGLPEGWHVIDAYVASGGDLRYGSTDGGCCYGLEPCSCIGGATVWRMLGVVPASTSEFGEHALNFSLSNETYGSRANASARYYLYSAVAGINATRAQDGLGVSYALNVTNAAPDFCSGRAFYASIDAPAGWGVSGNGSAIIGPGGSATLSWSLWPIPGKATSGWMNIIIASDASDSAKMGHACAPGAAQDVAAGAAGQLFYSTADAIYAFNTTDCAPGAAPLITSTTGYIRGIDYAAGRLFWAEEAGNAMVIRSYELASGNLSEIAVAGRDTWHVAADANAAYWIENDAVKRISLADGTVSTVADGLDAPLGLDADDGFVYWAERSRIGRVAKGASCSGSACASVLVPDNFAPSFGRFRDVASDGSRLFTTVDASGWVELPVSKAAIMINSSKVLGIELATNRTIFAYMPRVLEGVTAITADESYVYWLADGSGDRMNKFTAYSNVSELLVAPGRKPAAVSIVPTEGRAAAGTRALFHVTITSNNSAELEPSALFGIKDVELADGAQLCDGYGMSGECEGDTRWNGERVTRADILSDYYSTIARRLAPGESGSIALFIRPDPGVPIGTKLALNVTAGSADPATDGRAAAALNVTPPGPPLVVVRQTSECWAGNVLLTGGYVRPECSANFSIEITNQEALDADYIINVTQVNATATTTYWDMTVEPDKLEVPGTMTYDNIREASLQIAPKDPTFFRAAYGRYTFAVNVSNRDFPAKWTAANVTLIVTPDDRDGVCEESRGETPENTPDCAINAEVFRCAFSGECDMTTDDGVAFGILPTSGLQRLGACNFTSWLGKAHQFESCIQEMTGTPQRLLCSAAGPNCTRVCREQDGLYFLIANISNGLGGWYNSSTFEWACPACIGRVHSELMSTDYYLQLTEPERAAGNVSFAAWLEYIKSRLYSADWWGIPDCEAAAKDVVDQGKGYLAQAAAGGAAQCGSLREDARRFVERSDALLIAVCRQGAKADLKIAALNISNATYGQPIVAQLEIENRASEPAFAQARCRYRRALWGATWKSDASACRVLAPGATAHFNVSLAQASVGDWLIECVASWSTFEDCRVVVDTDTAMGAFKVAPPAASLMITGYQIPDFGVQEQEAHIRVDVTNSGEAANASVSCFVTDAEGMLHEFESDVAVVEWNRTEHFFVEFRPQITGDWTVQECTVYKIGSKVPHHTEVIGRSFVIWPACTSVCEGLGWDFGGCFVNASAPVGVPGQHGCGAAESCACGNLTITEKLCVRMSAAAGNGIYNASISGTWQTGDALWIDGRAFAPGAFAFSKLFGQRGDYALNATVYKSTMPIYRKAIMMVCREKPLINITAPKDGSTVSGLQRVNVQLADAKNASLRLDGDLVAESEAFATTTFDLQTADWPDGTHTLSVRACNEVGCASKSATITIANAPLQFDFTLDPQQSASDVSANQSVNCTFTLRNAGGAADTYVLAESLNRTWSTSAMLNGEAMRRTVALSPGEMATFIVTVRVPAGAALNDRAALNVSARGIGAGVTKVSGPHILRVAAVPNSPPQIHSVHYLPAAVYKGETVTFFADIADPDGDALVEGAVCKSPACGQAERWCDLPVSGSQGSFNCSVGGAIPGNYSYYIFVRDADGMSAVSSARTLLVAEQPLPPGAQQNIADRLLGVTANASSSLPGQPPENAIDGDNSTYWTSQELPAWLQIDLQSPRWVGGVGIYSASDARPKSFDVLVGDCANFATAHSESAARYAGGWYRTAFDAVLGRCVKLHIRATEDGSPYASIASFEVYEGAPPEGARAAQCGNGICETGETAEDCPADCAPVRPAPAPGLPVWVWIIFAGAAAGAVLWALPRIRLWWEFWRG